MYNKIFTHRALFHADEVFACAIIKMINENVEIYRVSIEVAQSKKGAGIIIDTGGEYDTANCLFDHHQEFLTREDGFPYASAGLVWNHYGEGIVNLDKDVANRVDEILIKGIDATDSDPNFSHTATCSAGDVRLMTLSGIISSFNTESVQDDEAQAVAFDRAIGFATMILEDAIKSAKKHVAGEREFKAISIIEGEVLTLEKFVPWKEIVHNNYPQVKFVISPGTQSPYQLLGVPVEPQSRELKQPIERPDWFEGFIHGGKFIAGCDSLEQAQKLAKAQI